MLDFFIMFLAFFYNMQVNYIFELKNYMIVYQFILNYYKILVFKIYLNI